MNIPTTNNFLLVTQKVNAQDMQFKNVLCRKAGFLVIFVSTLFMPILGYAQVSGTVFRDFNANGTMDNSASFNEVGVGGIVVNAYNSAGALLATQTSSTTTATLGQYSFPASGANSIPSGTSVRLEFTGFATGDYPAANANSFVQFVSAPITNVNMGVNNPEDYVGDTNPYVVAPKYVNGTYNGGSASFAALHSFVYNSTGNIYGGAYAWSPDNVPNNKALIGEMGAAWGVAYQRSTKTLYTSAVIRRFCGLGSLGTGGIYKVDMTNPSANTGATNFIDVQTIGINTGADVRTASGCNAVGSGPLTPANDIAGGDNVGKLGIGGIEYDESRNTLWLVNLYDRKLYGINNLNPNTPPTASNVIGGYSITLPSGYSVTNGELRPWGVKVHKGMIYIGVVTDGSLEADLSDLTNVKGYILKFNPANPTAGFTVEFTFGFDYPHPGYSEYSGTSRWMCWVDNSTYIWVNQPIISDIEFDVDGSLIIGVMDRGGMQNGNANYNERTCTTSLSDIGAQGDILRACKVGGSYVFSGNSGCTTTIPTSVRIDADGDPAAPNNYIQEYYWGEQGPDANVNNEFNETALGALTLVPGSNQVLTVSMDVENWHSGGVLTLDNTTGGTVNRYNLYHSDPSSGSAFMAKAIGLGDIEVIANTPAIEIGNRVWNDTNKNGIQDAGEAGVAGVTIQLSKYNGTSYVNLATCTTDANGNYYFSNATGTSAAGITYNISGLTPNSQFKLSIPTTYNGLMLTAPNIVSGSNSDEIDSDADGFGTISFTTGNVGENNHSYDIGFQTPIEICTGEEYTLSVPAGTTGQWYKDGLPIAGATGISYVVTTAGNYNFIGTNASGCSFTSCTNAAFIQGNCARVGNYVWNDTNADGLNNEAASAGINGVHIQLYRVNGGGSYTLVDSTITANNSGKPGYYQFVVHTFGDYLVRFIAPTGKNLTKTNQAANTDNNSDADGVGVSGIINLVAGTNDSTIDAGFVNGCAIGNVLYLCGNSKPADADAFDHGMIQYLQGLGNTITPALTQNTSGLGLYNPMTMVALSLSNFNGFDAVFVSPSVEGVYTSTLIDSLKKSRLPIWVSDYWTLGDLGLATNVGFNFQDDVYDGTAQVPFYNYTLLNPTQYSTPGLFYGTPEANADNKLLWVDAYAKSTGSAGVYFTYEPTDVLNNPVTANPINNHGRRVFLGIHSNGLYANPTNGGSIPSPASAWLNPYTHLTSYGKRYLDSALAMMCTVKAPAGSIGNFVWNDTDGDGSQDAGETGINGVKVKLYQDNGSGTYILIDSTTTATNGGNAGYYAFTGLGSWNYYVNFPTTTGASIPLTVQTVTAATDGNSDANSSTGNSPIFAINASGTGTAKDNPTIDAGYYYCALSMISGLTINTIDYGPQTAPQPETVTLNAGGNLLPESNVAGFYHSSTSEGALYTFCSEISQPILPLQNPYTHELTGSANGFTATQAYRLAQVVQAAGFNSQTGLGAGNNTVTNLVALQLAAWNAIYDTDYSVSAGNFQSTTSNNAGAVALANTWLTAAQAITTPTSVVHKLHHASGQDLFMTGDVPPITVQVTPPTCSGTGAPNNATMTVVGFSAGQRYQYSTGTTFNSAAATPASPTAIPVGGVVVNNLTNTTQTYTIRIYDASNDACFTDRTVTINSIICVGSVGNYVWNDVNGNGTQDAGETGINGVTVELYKETAPSSGSYALAQTTTTATNAGNAGYYNFVITQSANYYVHFPTTTGGKYVSTQTQTAATDGNSDANTSTGNSPIFAINVNGTGTAKDNPTIDAGYHLAAIGNYVWYDTDRNGLQNEPASNGLNGETVLLWQVGNPYAVASTTTANDINGNPGFYQFTGLAAGTYKVSFPNAVTLPGGATGYATIFDTTALVNGNSDMIPQSSNFTPAIVLAAGEVNNTIDAGFTDCGNGGGGSGGQIGISTPTCFIPGNPITFHTTNIAPYTLTSPVMQIWLVHLWSGGTANTYMYSTIDSLTFTHTITNTTGLDSIEVRRCVNTAGCAIATYESNIATLYPCKGSVGNYVWNDYNANGLNDEPASAGVNGVVVELWKETSVGSGTYTLLSTTTTANNGSGNPGYYNFVVAQSANYKVKFPTTNNNGTLTTQTITAATDNNSDADVVTGFSPVFAINVGGTGTAKDNNTLDAGYKSTVSTAVTVSGCYDSNGNLSGGLSQVDVQVTLSWTNPVLSDSIVVTVPGAATTQIVNPNTATSPVVLTFAVPTSTATTGNVTAKYIVQTSVAATPFAINIPVSNCLQSIACNTKTPLTNANYTNLAASITDNVSSVVPLCLGSISNVANLVDNSSTNYASIDITGVACNGTMSVKDNDASDTYPAGVFAGFRVSSNNLLTASIAATVTIETWNNGALKETYNAVTSLVGVNSSLLNSDGTVDLGFITSQPFDELRIKYQSLVGVLFHADIYYPIIEEFCTASPLACNVQTAMNNTLYPTIIDDVNTGVTGLACAGCSVSNAVNVISASNTDYATLVLTAGVANVASIAVKEVVTDYAAGSFVGFNIENQDLINTNLVAGITLKTYLNGTLKETMTGANLLSVGSSLFTGSGTQLVGFLTTQSFDEVKLEMVNTLGILSTTKVYNAVFETFCAGPALNCNTLTSIVNPDYPVYVDGRNSGINTITCVGCSLNNPTNVIDANTSNYASLILTAGVASSGSFAVADAISTYPANTFAGFDIENPSLLNANALGAVTISLLNNGVVVQTGSGSSQLVTIGSSLLTGTNRQIIGTVANVPFDEVKITFANLAALNLGTTNIYNLVFQKSCSGSIACGNTYLLDNPDFPVVVEGTRTGIVTGACAGCSVNNAWNVITASNTDYARINLTAGALTAASISVRDIVTDYITGSNQGYPQGTVAGFVVRDPNSFLQATLFNAITITTYLNGVQQESKTGGNLLDLDVLVPLIGSGSGTFNVGFITSLPWNEVQITYSNVLGALTYLDVYGAYVDPRYIPSGVSGFYCNGSVGNYVWNDTDADGTQDAGETGINGVTVELYKETTAGSGSYALAQTTTTATNAGNAGYYNFVITQSANYYVHFPTTNGANVLSPVTTTAATDGNSDANISTGNSPIFAINVGGTGTAKDNPTIDAGYRCTKPNAGINQTLCAGTCASLTGTSTTTGTWTAMSTNPTGATLGTTTAGVASVCFATTAAGTYNFIYTVGVCTDTMSVLVNPKPTLVASDEYVCYKNATTSVTLTSNVAGSWAAYYGASIYTQGTSTIVSPNSMTTEVNNFQYGSDPNYEGYGYVFTSASGCKDSVGVIMLPRVVIGNHVWSDSNNNGLDDEPASAGINGVKVYLYYSQDTATSPMAMIDSTITANDASGNPGYYYFSECVDGLFQVKFPTTVASVGLTTQTPNDGVDGNSDADIFSGFSPYFGMWGTGIGVNVDNQTIDAGYKNIGSVGNYVWNDTDADGTQDADETGINGVTVELYKETAPNSGSYTLAQTTTTATNAGNAGYYNFVITQSANYYVHFPTATSGKTLSLQTTTAATDGNSDANVSTGNSPIFALNLSGTGTAKDNPTIDAGYKLMPIITAVASACDANSNQYSVSGTITGTFPKTGQMLVNIAGEGSVLYSAPFASSPIAYSITGLISDGASKTVTITFTDAPNLNTSVNYNAPTACITNSCVSGGAGAETHTYTLPLTTTDVVNQAVTLPKFDDMGGTRILEKVLITQKQSTISAGLLENTSATMDSFFLHINTKGLLSMSGDTLLFADYDANYDNKELSANVFVPTNAAYPSWLGDVNQPIGAGFVPSTLARMQASSTVVSNDLPNFIDPRLNSGWVTNITGNATHDDDIWYISPLEMSRSASKVITTSLSNYIGTGNLPMLANADAGFGLQGGGGNIVFDLRTKYKTEVTVTYYYCPAATVGNYVWTDTDADGSQDAGETGINGVTVELYKETTPSSGVYALAQTTVTANDGNNDGAYKFIVNETANYYVHFPTVAGVNILTMQTSTAATDGNSDANFTTGNSPIFAMDVNGTGIAKDNPTIDAGYTPVSATVGDYVWLDTDKDGQQDANEKGVAGVTVSLINNLNEIVATTQTDAYGYYLFHNVTAGDYTVRFSLPIAYTFTIQEATPSATGSDANGAGYTNTFHVNTGDNITDIDAGIYYEKVFRSGLGNFVWLDANANGRQDANETGVSNVAVMLYNTSGILLQATLTNSTGYYQFLDLPAGNYVVGVRLPLGYQFVNPNVGGNDNIDSDILPSTGKTATIVLPANTFDQTNDAGLVAIVNTQASIGDYVWNDSNHNGLQEADEVGVSNVIVELWDDQNNLMQTTRTDAYGYYMFTDITAGFYSVKFELPAGWLFSTPNAGTDDDIDSDVITAIGGTDTIRVSEGDRITNVDAGVYNPAATVKGIIGDYVWYDLDKDGVQDATEAGVPGVMVTLYDGSNFVIAQTTTDKNGKYLFVDLPVGTYSVGFSNIREGYTFTTPSQGGDGSLDSDVIPSTGKTATISLTSNAIYLDLDAGIYPINQGGSYASLGDRVWYDVNNNGLQDAGEVGASNVIVRLYDATNTQIALTLTDGSGRYLFSRLNAGTYTVNFTLPSGYTFSPQNQGTNDNVDSDVNFTGTTASITLMAGENNMSVDAGLYKNTGTASIGDFVWNDVNNDGVQNVGEKGVSGVSVTLYNASGTPIAATVTDKNGYYLFPYMSAGNYSVGFNNFPAGFALVPASQGGNTATDSDPNVITGRTSIFSLATGQAKTDIDAGLYAARASLGDYVWNDANANGLQDVGEDGVAGITVHLFNSSNQYISSSVTDANGYYLFYNLTAGSYYVNVSDLPTYTAFTTQDAGDDALDSDINPVTALSQTIALAANDFNKTVDAGLNMNANASMEGYVWFDANGDGLQDVTEAPVTGVLVTLETLAGVPLSRTISGADGMYHFENVIVGSYKVRFSNIPTGSRFTASDINGGNNDRLDSDANPSTGLSTSSYTVISGQRLHAADAGILPPGSIAGTAFEDAGTPPNGLQDPTEITFSNILVMLYTSDSTLVGTTFTDKKGNYLFTGLYPDNYFVVFDVLSGRAFTAKNIDGNLSDDIDSDVNFFGGTDVFALGVGENVIDVDAGYLPAGFIFPVTMAYFTAELVNADGLLKWKTTAEVNTKHFEIYRSLDEFSYEKIGNNVTATGTPTTSTSYNTFDYNVNKLNVDRVFYRLKIVDVDGSFNWSNVVSLNLTHTDQTIFAQVYPNPAETTVWVDYQLFDGEIADLKVTNATGQAIYMQTIKAKDYLQQLSIDISKWADGVYYLNIQSENGNFVRKIIKE